MRVVFERRADRRPVETLVERDDGVVFLMRGAGGGADLPHDLVHALVERHLDVTDGIFGCIADGVVWTSMRHVGGRRPPHAAEHSARLMKQRRARILAAEHLADLVRRLSRGAAVLPGEDAGTGYPLEALRGAAAELATAATRWAALSPGDRWEISWAQPAARGSTPGHRAAGRGPQPR